MPSTEEDGDRPAAEWDVRLGRRLLRDVDLGEGWQWRTPARALDLSDAAAVVVDAAIGERADTDSARRLPVWSVGVIARSRASDAVARLERLLREPETREGRPHGYRATRRHRRSVTEPLRALLPALAGATVVVGDHPECAASLRVAEALARALDLPLLDRSGEAPRLRPRDELGIPLVERLARGLAELPDDPGDPPPRVRCRAGGDLVIGWYHALGATVLLLLPIGAALGWFLSHFAHAAGDATGYGDFGDPVRGAVVGAVAATLLFCAWPSGWRWSELRVSGDAIVVRRGPHRLWAVRMPVADLQALRVSAPDGDGLRAEGLRLLTDSRSILLEMTTAQATWIAARITLHLADR